MTGLVDEGLGRGAGIGEPGLVCVEVSGAAGPDTVRRAGIGPLGGDCEDDGVGELLEVSDCFGEMAIVRAL